MSIFTKLIIGAGMVFMIMAGIGTFLYQVQHTAIQIERGKQYEEALKKIQDRDMQDATIGKMDDPTVCREFGNKWVHDHCESR